MIGFLVCVTIAVVCGYRWYRRYRAGCAQGPRRHPRCMLCGQRHRSPYCDVRPPIPPAIRQMVYARDGHRCRWCGSPFRLQVDHMIPRSRGGPDDLSNYQTLCAEHNRMKGATLMVRPEVPPWVSGERVEPYRGRWVA
jgi:5-methylcytosine-specific restriction endonuclease McrA